MTKRLKLVGVGVPLAPRRHHRKPGDEGSRRSSNYLRSHPLLLRRQHDPCDQSRHPGLPAVPTAPSGATVQPSYGPLHHQRSRCSSSSIGALTDGHSNAHGEANDQCPDKTSWVASNNASRLRLGGNNGNIERRAEGSEPARTEPATKGFTLVELLVTIVLVFILATMALPSFFGFLQNQRATTEANNFVTAVHLARNEAVKRGDNVELCASDDGTTCGGSWTDGWLVRLTDGTQEVIRVWDEMGSGAKLTETGTATKLAFNERGEALNARSFTLWFEACSGDRTRSIEINKSGRPSLSRTDAKCD